MELISNFRQGVPSLCLAMRFVGLAPGSSHTSFEVVTVSKGSSPNIECIPIPHDNHAEAEAASDNGSGGTDDEIDNDNDADAIIRRVIGAYTDYEAFHVDRCEQGNGDGSDQRDGKCGGPDSCWTSLASQAGLSADSHCPLTIRAVANSSGVDVRTWSLFMTCKIRQMCAWELSGLPVNLDNEHGEVVKSNGMSLADTVLPSKAAFLFEAWITDPSVRNDLESRGLIVDPGPSECNPKATASTQDGGGSESEKGADETVDASQQATCEVRELLRTKFGMDDEAVDGTKGSPDGFFKWSVISRIAQVGNPNFKKFRCTKRFTDRVSNVMADTCKREGMAHMLSPEVALEVLRMCAKV